MVKYEEIVSKIQQWDNLRLNKKFVEADLIKMGLVDIYGVVITRSKEYIFWECSSQVAPFYIPINYSHKSKNKRCIISKSLSAVKIFNGWWQLEDSMVDLLRIFQPSATTEPIILFSGDYDEENKTIDIDFKKHKGFLLV